MKNPRNSSKKRVLLAALVIVALLAGGVFAYQSQQDNNQAQSNDTDSLETINYDPPTDQEESAGNEQKQDNADRQAMIDQAQEQKQDNAGKQQVEPYISSWGQNPDNGNAEVNGFLTQVYEDGGTCTLTMQKGSQTATASRKGTKDAKTTNCGLLVIARSKLSAGAWEATLSYSSASAAGTSKKVTIEIK